MKKKLLFCFFSSVLLIVILYFELISYGLGQLRGQLEIIFNTIPTSELLADPTVSDSVKNKIEVVNAARRFAVKELSLKPTENYTTYYDQKGSVALWNLSASKAFELAPKMWKFPLLGSFPYKGFFDLEKAKEELKLLKANGYDARIRPVGGWSTLGWTKDPILSNMLQRSDGALAELIIHELTHTTLFVKDNVDFNENLASFIGEQGALLFLDSYFDSDQPKQTYLSNEADARRFRSHMLRGTQRLDSLYRGMQEIADDSIKISLKKAEIQKIVDNLDTITFSNQRYKSLFGENLPNNAFFMSYKRYYSKKDSLDDLLKKKYQGDLALFIEGMRAFHSK